MGKHKGTLFLPRDILLGAAGFLSRLKNGENYTPSGLPWHSGNVSLREGTQAVAMRRWLRCYCAPAKRTLKLASLARYRLPLTKVR
jgi:hypothetical protein